MQSGHHDGSRLIRDRIGAHQGSKLPQGKLRLKLHQSPVDEDILSKKKLKPISFNI